MKEILAVVVARKGSKGFPGKHLQNLGGRPVIQHTFDYLSQVGRSLQAVVSTDDEQIAALAHDLGVEVVDRPAELATDDCPSGEALRHAVLMLTSREGCDGGIAILLQANVPVRPPGLIERACSILESSDADSVTPLIKHRYHPLYSVELDASNRVERWLGMPPASRQQLPAVYSYGGGCWIVRAGVLRDAIKTSDDPHWMFGARVVGLPYDAFAFAEIDEPRDLAWAEFLLSQQPS